MLMKCVECETEPMFKANLIKEAANVIKVEDPDRYIKLASEAIDMYAMAGRSSGAAGLSKDCAEKLEDEFELEKAATFYKKASELYDLDNQGLQANSMMNKYCDLAILSLNEKLDFATITRSYEKIGFKYLT